MDLRDLPSVDGLAATLSAESAAPDILIVSLARDAIEGARKALTAGEAADPVADARDRLASVTAARLRGVINATGVLLHTNLGRAPLAEAAAAAAVDAAGYVNLEMALDDGRRNRRGRYPTRLLAALAGADAGLVVNNNAGALLLALASLAGRDGRIAVSRGELIEIGGSFRLPDVIAASGVRLVEVGTTNRTRLADYGAVAGHVDAILKVHPSNYRVAGFTEEVTYRELAELASAHELPLIADVGSGLLDARAPWTGAEPPRWLAGEPGVRQTVEVGADVVLFSGDKLFGGPQAGIAVGGAAPIAAMAAHPLARALRVEGATLAALTVTAEMYAGGEALHIPFWTMAATPYQDLEARCRSVLAASGAEGAVLAAGSLPGAGSVPGSSIPSPNIVLEGSADRLWEALAGRDPSIVCSRRDGALHLDLRTVAPEDDDLVSRALRTTAA